MPKRWLIAAVFMLCACGDDSSESEDAATEPEDAATCTELEVGCECADEGEVMCRTPGPDLLCTGGTWAAAFDGPCPGLDLGPGRDFGP